ncbi:hypothetical protein ERJ75_001163400 [Trypanosoma vivax]|uniref:Uncharacterized protein n=1 Tax=Trypanosoma vivax (strain Y486) TaxID=1055687 RepID=G0TXW5_TRYVY|nr:hypothetical protein TRVL_07855 [Trypanosoma vivax]KAH8609840.1 hypothetical protein ERJ75_001163400 [Trypanosoma vivax]CCC48808.1 conserved hypothetical protein [Trypanosoma vivax Y486]
MGQKQSAVQTVHQLVYNKEHSELASFLSKCDVGLVPGSLDDSTFVELIRQSWDAETIFRLAKLGNDRQIALLVASAVVHDHPLPLEPLFAMMRDRDRAVEAHHLKHLFLTACERGNVSAVRAFIANKCFDPSDSRPVRAVVCAQLIKAVADTELLQMLLETHPVKVDDLNYLLGTCLPNAEHGEVKTAIEQILLKNHTNE